MTYFFPVLQLPDHLITQVLEILDDRDVMFRMSASHVSKRFHAAALAATRKLWVYSPRQMDGVLPWLKRHGSSVEFLQYSTDWQDPDECYITELPCPRLRELELDDCHVQLSRTAQHNGILSGCPSLQSMRMELCTIRDVPGELLSLNQLTSLQHLHLEFRCAGKQSYHYADYLEPPNTVMPPGALSPLLQLTYLFLGFAALQFDAALQDLSCLVNLQHLGCDYFEYDYPDPSEDDYELALSMPQRLTSASLEGLQHLHRLTSLHLTNFTWSLDAVHPPGIPQVTALRSLKLWANYEDSMVVSPNPYPGGLNPAVLSTFTGLQQMTISLRQTWHPADVSALLAGVGCMKQLSSLHISNSPWFCPTAAAYAGLTASSCLQKVQLSGCYLPSGAWLHMCPAGKQLPQLQDFSCTGGQQGPSAQMAAAAAVPSAAEFHALASCCPDLRNMELQMPGVPNSFVALGQLTGLESFWFLHMTACTRKIPTTCLTSAPCSARAAV